jgi:serine/threonine-protein kinase
MDFGIAKVVAGTGQASSSAVVGTPTYMAPEQIRESAAIGPATDLYALGHIAYTLLTGRAYWSEEKSRLDLVPFLLGVASGAQEAPSARAARSGVALPPAFDVWFARATATDPRQRFSLASAMIAELSVALELPSGAAAPTPSAIPPGHSAAVATPAELGVTPPTVSTEDGASVARPVSSTPRRRSVLVLAFASIAGAGVGAALWIGSLRSTTTGSPPSQPAAAATSAAPLAVAAKEQSTAAPAESERPAVAPSPSEAPTIASSAAAPSSSARAPARAPAAPPAKPARKGEGLL